MKNLVLIGPVFPYKGGISHYTGLMYRALSGQYHTDLVSYSFQYPKFLYHKEQKDFENDAFRIEDTKYWIHTANPINWVHMAHRILKRNPDMVIVQWWHPYFAPCYRILCGILNRHVPVVFVCHNVFPHEHFPMDRLLTRMALSTGSGFIVHSKSDEEDLHQLFSTAVCRRTVHPTYNAFQFEHLSMREARQRLGLGEQEHLLLFFGFVREYKGLRYLLQAMPKILAANPNTRLMIVGDFGSDEDSYLELIRELGIGEQLLIRSGYTPDREVEPYFAAADLVMLPYTSATQSGVAQIAYGFEKPVIATEVGGLPDVVTDGQTGYLVPPEDPDALADAVTRFYQESAAKDFAEHVRAEAYRFSWDRMVEVVDSLDTELQIGRDRD